MMNETNGTTGMNGRYGVPRDSSRRFLKVIPGGKKAATPEPFDLTDLRRDSFLRGHYLEKSPPNEIR
jgi:hypothetical protein